MDYRPVEGWGRLPEGYAFVEATSVAVDARDNVYVFNRGKHPVIVFDREGKFLRSWGEGVFRRAHGITIGPDGSLWLTDDLHHTIRQFTPEGKLLLTIGDPDKPSTLYGGKPFNRPTHVALCPRTGDVYISDGYGNCRVHKFDPKGRHISSWGEPGTDPGCFNVPHNIATDAAGLVYVADRENHRIQVFDGSGQYLAQWNNLHRPCGLAADARQGDIFFVGELGSDLAVNAATPNIGNRVSILSIKGELISRVGGGPRGEKPGQFVAPHGVATDSHGDLYVAEVSYTSRGSKETPPREIRSLQKVRTRMSLLNDKAITEGLRELPGWSREGKVITKSYRFKDFTEAMVFVNAVAAVAEKANHHPDITLHDFRDVTLRLSTHHDRGITAHDLALARAIEGIPGASRPS